MESLLTRAIDLGRQHNVVKLDAPHIAAAERAGVNLFLTAEKPGKPMFKAVQVCPKSIHDL